MIHKKSSFLVVGLVMEGSVELIDEVVEEAAEEEAVAVVVGVVQDLLPNLSQQARAKLLSQLQQMLEPWVRNQQSSQAIAPKQTTSLKKLKLISASTKMSPGLIL